MNKALILGALFGAFIARAQQQPQQPSVMPSAAAYRQAADILKGETSAQAVPPPGTKGKRKGRSVPQIQGTISSSAIEVERQAPLPPSARLALAISEGWLNTGPEPLAGPDGRVLYVYGQGVPTVVCAVFQVCELDLEAGESPKKDALDWGDHRFEVAARTAGSGNQEFTYLVLKPTEAGLDTTMTIGTNKRPYYVRLVSTRHDHMARVAFSYPEEEAAKRKEEAEARKAEERRQQSEVDRLAKLNTQKAIRNWNYRVKMHGKDAAYLKPEKIGDDGVHTHIVRDRGRREKRLSEEFELYMTVPRAASFAVTFRVGRNEQLSLSGLSTAEDVIDELLQCLEIFARGDNAQLKERIQEEAYYRNFVGLASSIAPDGRDVDVVGFTTLRRGELKKVAMRGTDAHVPLPAIPLPDQAEAAPVHTPPVVVEGVLKLADSTKEGRDEIQIIDANHMRHVIVVPPRHDERHCKTPMGYARNRDGSEEREENHPSGHSAYTARIVKNQIPTLLYSSSEATSPRRS